MKADEIFNVLKEMEALFIDYSMQHNTILSNGKPLDMQLGAISELQRVQAKAATDIVVKHCRWPSLLSEQLAKVTAYIDAHPERHAE